MWFFKYCLDLIFIFVPLEETLIEENHFDFLRYIILYTMQVIKNSKIVKCMANPRNEIYIKMKNVLQRLLIQKFIVPIL